MGLCYAGPRLPPAMDLDDSRMQDSLLHSAGPGGEELPTILLDGRLLDEMLARQKRASDVTQPYDYLSAPGWQAPRVVDLAGVIPGCEIESFIARGGMGAVYRARQTRLGRLVAVKLLPRGTGPEDAEQVERFTREARAMAKSSHPAILPIYELGETKSGLLYYVMEYVDGCDLAAAIRMQRRLDPAHAVAICIHVCEALEFAHRKGIIHRDIKPSNIMLSRQGVVKVADFGLAKFIKGEIAQLTLPNALCGTPEFLAPELMRHGAAEANPRTDIFALGVSLYQMVTGVVPRGAYLPPSARVPGIDPRLDAVIEKAMAQRAEDRYADAAEMRAALQEVLTPARVATRAPAVVEKPAISQPAPHQPPTPQNKPVRILNPHHPGMPDHDARPHRRSRRTLGALAAVALLGALGAGAFFWSAPRGKEPVRPDTGAAVAKPAVPEPPQNTVANAPSEFRAKAVSSPPAPASFGFNKDRPLINSLGMKFVPVPGTDILMCIHETRKKDYEEYAASNPGTDDRWKKVEFRNFPVSDGDDHPVVMVSWKDAKAFCTWLGKKEGRAYRLANGIEWTAAAGKDEYPWGGGWPPPKGAGNFADSSLEGKVPGSAIIPGYADGYATTAPVMSFAPNPLGIYDLPGNVREFIEDSLPGVRYDGYSASYIVRGGSWIISDPEHLQTKNINFYNEDYRHSSNGFRCVLETGRPGTASSASTRPPDLPPTSAASPQVLDGKSYADETATDIAAAAANRRLTTQEVTGSDGEELLPGTWFICQTSAGHFGKFKVDKFQEKSLFFSWVVYNENGLIRSFGSNLEVGPLYAFNLDTGSVVETAKADFYWRALDASRRYLVPVNGTRFMLVHRAEGAGPPAPSAPAISAHDLKEEGYENMTATDIASAVAGRLLTKERIDGSDGQELLPGSWFICRTCEGNFGKFKVEKLQGKSLVLSWVLFNSSKSGVSSGSSLVVGPSLTFDLEAGAAPGESGKADFEWWSVNASSRFLVPLSRCKCLLIHRESDTARATPPKTPERRTWTDDQGRKIEAAFVKLEGGNVSLETAGGVYNVPLAKLSMEDQHTANELARPQPPPASAGNPGTLPPRRQIVTPLLKDIAFPATAEENSLRRYTRDLLAYKAWQGNQLDNAGEKERQDLLMDLADKNFDLVLSEIEHADPDGDTAVKKDVVEVVTQHADPQHKAAIIKAFERYHPLATVISRKDWTGDAGPAMAAALRNFSAYYYYGPAEIEFIKVCFGSEDAEVWRQLDQLFANPSFWAGPGLHRNGRANLPALTGDALKRRGERLERLLVLLWDAADKSGDGSRCSFVAADVARTGKLDALEMLGKFLRAPPAAGDKFSEPRLKSAASTVVQLTDCPASLPAFETGKWIEDHLSSLKWDDQTKKFVEASKSKP